MRSSQPRLASIPTGPLPVRWAGNRRPQTWHIDIRWSAGQCRRHSQYRDWSWSRLAPDAIQLAPAGTLCRRYSGPAATIPIVFRRKLIDPVGGGFIKSLRRAGGNTTGLSLNSKHTSQNIATARQMPEQLLKPRGTRGERAPCTGGTPYGRLDRAMAAHPGRLPAVPIGRELDRLSPFVKEKPTTRSNARSADCAQRPRRGSDPGCRYAGSNIHRQRGYRA